MKRKKSKVRVIRHKQKYTAPKPDCPHCGKGFVRDGEYTEVATEETDEYRTRFLYCTRCDWRLFEDDGVYPV